MEDPNAKLQPPGKMHMPTITDLRNHTEQLIMRKNSSLVIESIALYSKTTKRQPICWSKIHSFRTVET